MATSSATSGLPVIAFANRLPVRRVRSTWRLSDGGLVTALRPAMKSRGGVWVGWDGGVETPREVEGLEIELRPVSLTRREVDDYYHGFANRTLWPLLHGLVEWPTFDRSWWDAYRFVNAQFAAADDPSAAGFRWVHDYHLLLLPGLVRQAGAQGGIGFFLHVPFPPPEVFSRLPWRSTVLEGMLGAEIVSFHTASYRDNFLRTCRQLLDGVEIHGTSVSCPDGRAVRTAAHPISIDAGDLAERGAARRRLGLPAWQAVRRPRLLPRRPPLDYTKGIPERLRAIELLLELRPDLHREITFVQVAVPSRGEIREYRELVSPWNSSSAGSMAASRSRGSTCRCITSTAASPRSPARLLSRGRDLPCDTAPGRDESGRQGVRDGAAGDQRLGRARAERIHGRDRGAAGGTPLQPVRPGGPRRHDQPGTRPRRGRPPQPARTDGSEEPPPRRVRVARRGAETRASGRGSAARDGALR